MAGGGKRDVLREFALTAGRGHPGIVAPDRFDRPPCLRLGEALYIPNGAKEFLPAGAVFYGRIEHCVDDQELPEEDLQANRPWDGRAVYVLHPEVYCVYVEGR